jgi:hypothetical protein
MSWKDQSQDTALALMYKARSARIARVQSCAVPAPTVFSHGFIATPKCSRKLLKHPEAVENHGPRDPKVPSFLSSKTLKLSRCINLEVFGIHVSFHLQ